MGKANLNMILRLLDERNIAKEVSMYHDIGRDEYNMQNRIPSTFDEMMAEATRFYQQQFQITVGGDILMPEWLALSNVRGIIERSFSQIGGLEGAYMVASTGVGGGMKAVLDAIYEHMKKEQEEKYISWILVEHVDVMSWDDKVLLMQQYLAKFHSSMPEGARIKSAEQLVAAGYEDIIKLHMKALQTIRTRVAP
ncbi:MAG: hypothetical protein P9L98_01570 [Candidatus Kaelpia imicola]|nr:hypothetical protein [Candidatus Kaelpia imicola]